MAWQWYRGGHVVNMMGCDYPRFVQIGPLGGELWHFQYFPTWRPAAILNFKNFHIWSRDCHCGANLLLCTKFYQNCFTCRLPDVHNCRMFHEPLLGNGRCHGNRIMADMSWTWWDATTQVSSKSVLWEASYSISNIFQHGSQPPFWVLKILIFDHVAVIVVLICCCVPNFIKIGSRIRPPDAHNCRMFNALLLSKGHCHGNRIMADRSGTWCDATIQIGPLIGKL